MLSVLATLCLGCQTDLNTPEVQELSITDPHVIQQPLLFAGPYGLNPSLHQPIVQSGHSQQKPTSPQHSTQPFPPLPAITPTSQSQAGPQGGATFPTDVNIPTGTGGVPPFEDSQPYSPAPVPPNSPLLIISPAARPSGPGPRHTEVPNLLSSPAASQGGAATPTYRPTARPSGPTPRQVASPLPSSDDSQGGAATPTNKPPTYSPAARPSGPAPRPQDIPPRSSPDDFQGGAATPTDRIPVYSPATRPSGPTNIPALPSSSSPQDSVEGGAATPVDRVPTSSPTARPSGPVPRNLPSSTPLNNSVEGGAATPTDQTPHSSPAVRPSGPPLIQQKPQPTMPEASRNNPSPTSIPRFRSVPSPPPQQNISPTSQPVLVQDTPKVPAQTTAQSPTVPADIPIQQPKITPQNRLPTDLTPIGAADDPQVSFIVLENSTTDFKLDFDEFGKENLKIEEVVTFRVRNGDVVTFTTGMNTYSQDGQEPVKNIPLILGWETEVGEVSINVAAGAEVFNRLAPQPTFKVGAKTSLFGQVLVSGEVEHGPYKFNTTTLENDISYWRIRPSVFWQIDSKTTFFGLLQAGFFSDGNQEIQSFSRLERKIGPFSVAANVFTWNFAEDLEAESGYFSPLGFLLYNAEVGWKGKIFDPLTCQFAASIGNQVVNGGKSTGRGLQAKCTASLAENVELDFGYVLTNIISSGSGASNSHIFSGQLRIDF